MPADMRARAERLARFVFSEAVPFRTQNVAIRRIAAELAAVRAEALEDAAQQVERESTVMNWSHFAKVIRALADTQEESHDTL